MVTDSLSHPIETQQATARQIDIGHTVPSIVIKQQGKVVGLAWALGDETIPCEYTEYWFLTPDYIYPGSPDRGQSIRTVLRPLRNSPDFVAADEFYAFAQSRLGVGKRIESLVLEQEFCGADGLEPK